ncbi:MAG: ATP-binding cassette domain-containing protein [Nitrospirae bacterium]|nr:MAG: ATP-binding cassette domain-containing protein [Nitrospirota bacterium]
MVEIKQLRKLFGPIVAVDQVSFTVRQGEVLGFLGPNGAGKSTTMKMITGFLTPTSGTVVINGYDIQDQPLEAKRLLGYLPEGAPAYQDMTPLSFLTFIGEMRGFRGAELERRVWNTIHTVNLESVVYQPIETLSKGFKRRVGLAQAIIHDPPVLVMDEPTDGLDPNQKHEVRTLIKTMAQTKAIILSTHILEEVQAVCTRAIIIAKGKIITDGSPEELEARSPYHNAVTLKVKGISLAEVQKELESLPGVKGVEALNGQDGLTTVRVLSLKGQSLVGEVNRCVRERRWDVVELYVERGHLDEVFRALTAPAQQRT